MEDWTGTALWQALLKQGVGTETLRAWLTKPLHDAELVLCKGGTSALNFTLHDEQHARRVAELMAQIIPSESLCRLSCWELALLLLSAYLHDIGMTPAANRLLPIHGYVSDGDDAQWMRIDEADRDDLQEWIDEELPGLPQERPKAPAVRTFVAEFARHRHNDWSRAWINEHLEPGMDGYVDFRADLVALCGSHHSDCADLRDARFDHSTKGGASPAPLRLRYLAAMLRVADVMDIDPGRTPDVILRHRDVDDATSLTHWHKDQSVTVEVANASTVYLSARPASAVDYRAVADAADAVDRELAGCSALNAQGALCAPTDPPERAVHWSLPSSVERDIRERDNGFVYIDGAFRPDTERLLEMLGRAASQEWCKQHSVSYSLAARKTGARWTPRPERNDTLWLHRIARRTRWQPSATWTWSAWRNWRGRVTRSTCW